MFGNLAVPDDKTDAVISTLLRMLRDRSAIVIGWAIVSLTVLGRKHRTQCPRIARLIRRLRDDERVSIRSKVAKALALLASGNAPMPAGWVKAVGCGRRRHENEGGRR